MDSPTRGQKKEPMSKVLPLRLTLSDWKDFQDAAKLAGFDNPSSWIRYQARLAVRIRNAA